ncbi:hypothetical protein HBH56_187120 [Parastagonospora nodorum]|uniref:Uncharacterized protein n=1 Tax=Phaeosphaeria nodorum (strain SN15 / ATCC MYA-4574 / FGSC 10173) TaxID=321614 RepID=A0A7U2F9N7_PHANO|nr:hypothetical protein HBH56_187120 [Parastagonospora nodorum]QRD00988.1 hypothetical protein JI435_164330 [Parastagonospora nodorum SN15]KAH3925313.1 hypothetical protein HBH54_181430 [Parastagonospora nodorum]KAH3959164.1 hypothetical protein HBH52_245660 [Parastagonospora nodorum]KAH3991083.1 hypothetical protein HBI10_238380 [Parastagonospora nodorum]
MYIHTCAPPTTTSSTLEIPASSSPHVARLLHRLRAPLATGEAEDVAPEGSHACLAEPVRRILRRYPKRRRHQRTLLDHKENGSIGPPWTFEWHGDPGAILSKWKVGSRVILAIRKKQRIWVEGLKNRQWAIGPPTAGGPPPAGPSNYGGNSAHGDPIRNDKPPPLPSSGSPGAAGQCPYNPPILEHAIAGENPLPSPKKSCGTGTLSSVTSSGLATSTPSRLDLFSTVEDVSALPIMLLRSAIPTAT